ncbi:MAG: hypothetical protein ABF289_19690 [Clostridiales bacterium]
MNKTTLIKDIEEIIKNVFNFNIDYICKNKANYQTENLFELFDELKGRDLAYLLCHIENHFNIHINDNDIINGKFNCIQNIAELILSEKQKTLKI